MRVERIEREKKGEMRDKHYANFSDGVNNEEDSNDDSCTYKGGSDAFYVDEEWWNRRFQSVEKLKEIWKSRYGKGKNKSPELIEDQLKERVIDYNSKGEVRIRHKEDSLWNDFKEEKLLREVLLKRKEPINN